MYWMKRSFWTNRCPSAGPVDGARTGGLRVRAQSPVPPSRTTATTRSWPVLLVFPLMLTACWDGASPLGLSGVSEVTEVAVIGARAAPDFTGTGRLSLVVVPLHQGEVVTPESIRDVAVQAEAGPTQGTVIGTRVREPRTDGEIGGVVLLDSSGSMRQNDPQRLRVTAGQLFVDQLGAARERDGVDFTLGVFHFGSVLSTPGRFSNTQVLQDYTTDTQALRQGVAGTHDRGRGTPMFGSLREVIQELGTRFPGRAYRRLILLLSDGLDNWPSRGTLDQVVDLAVEHEVTILSVSLGQEADEQGLARIAQASGGTSLKVQEAAGLIQVMGLQAVPLTRRYLEADVRLTPVPPPGSEVPLRLDVNTGFRPVSARLVFTVP